MYLKHLFAQAIGAFTGNIRTGHSYIHLAHSYRPLFQLLLLLANA